MNYITIIIVAQICVTLLAIKIADCIANRNARRRLRENANTNKA